MEIDDYFSFETLLKEKKFSEKQIKAFEYLAIADSETYAKLCRQIKDSDDKHIKNIKMLLDCIYKFASHQKTNQNDTKKQNDSSYSDKMNSLLEDRISIEVEKDRAMLSSIKK